MENCVKLILPSQTTIVAGRIRRATKEGRDVFLTGNLMGGGPCVSALKRHLQAGYRVYATPLAARTIRDDPAEVQSMGVQIVASPPDREVVPIRTRDVDLEGLAEALGRFDVELPDRFSIAVQDHGECFGGSQRRFRFQYWERFVAGEGRLVELIYRQPPAYFTRMKAVQEDVPGALVMDTGAAAIWGALCDRTVADHRENGLIVVNVGNQHTIGALVRGERIYGLFEHHTVLMTPEKLADHVNRLRAATITNDEVFEENGHGAVIAPEYPADGSFAFVTVSGPQRAMAEGLGYHMAVPYGDMMLSGCFGLVAATRRLVEAEEAGS